MGTERVLAEYQSFLHDTSFYAHAHERNLKEMAYLTLGLAGEAGEFADEFKKLVREFSFEYELADIWDMTEGERLHLIDELGDVFWYLVRLCDMLGVSLITLMTQNALKLADRHGDDWPFGDEVTLDTVRETRKHLKEF